MWPSSLLPLSLPLCPSPPPIYACIFLFPFPATRQRVFPHLFPSFLSSFIYLFPLGILQLFGNSLLLFSQDKLAEREEEEEEEGGKHSHLLSTGSRTCWWDQRNNSNSSNSSNNSSRKPKRKNPTDFSSSPHSEPETTNWKYPTRQDESTFTNRFQPFAPSPLPLPPHVAKPTHFETENRRNIITQLLDDSNLWERPSSDFSSAGIISRGVMRILAMLCWASFWLPSLTSGLPVLRGQWITAGAIGARSLDASLPSTEMWPR